MPIPTPIGVGPRYHPPALHQPCANPSGQRVHLELFASKRVVLIPPGIGCWTSDPTGVLRFREPATLGTFFAAWRRPLSRHRLLSFRGVVRAWRNGVEVTGDPADVLLRDGDEIVVEVGGFVPPHRSYLFPRH